jgi:hypothetical protein
LIWAIGGAGRPFPRIAKELIMSKNKGGREVRKPKQVKKPQAAATPASVLHVERSGKPHSAKAAR